MANLPSCCGMKSKYMYPLVLPIIAQFCVKSTPHFLLDDPQIPFDHPCFGYYYYMKIKRAAAPFIFTPYALAHTSRLQQA